MYMCDVIKRWLCGNKAKLEELHEPDQEPKLEVYSRSADRRTFQYKPRIESKRKTKPAKVSPAKLRKTI